LHRVMDQFRTAIFKTRIWIYARCRRGGSRTRWISLDITPRFDAP
jgi:hypothetical protein